jgi:hypothetical protein
VTFTILSRFRSSAFTHFYPNRKIFARRAAWQGDLLRRDRGCSQYSSADGSTPRFCVSISMARWRTREYALPALVSEKNFAPAARALNFYRFTKTLHRMHFYHLMPKAAHFYRTLTLCSAFRAPQLYRTDTLIIHIHDENLELSRLTHSSGRTRTNTGNRGAPLACMFWYR